MGDAGEDGHGDLDVAALVGGGEDVEGGEGEAEGGADGRASGVFGWLLVDARAVAFRAIPHPSQKTRRMGIRSCGRGE